MPFRNRTEAGEFLATKLRRWTNDPKLLVLGLPRGGVPVAAEIAKRLNAPLDVFVVRKLGLPGCPELAMGAIASGGVRVLNRDVVLAAGVPQSAIDAVATKELEELKRREKSYRDGLPPPPLQGRSVLLVDDGIATGATMTAAVAALRKLKADWIIVAAPVIPQSSYREIAEVADEVVSVIAPQDFYGVGQWYEDFSQTTDEEVRRLLAELGQPESVAA